MRDSCETTEKHECKSPVQQINKSILLGVLLPLIFIINVAQKSIEFAHFESLGKFKTLTDYHAFYVAGKLALLNRLGEAYHFQQMQAAQFEFTGADNFLPWTYPLPFDLIVTQLARMPISLGYLLFIVTSLLMYFKVLKKISGENVQLLTVILLPSIFINIGCGQNGLLTGSLIGAFVLLFMERSRLSGIPLGLMVIKPHLAAGIGLYVLFKKDWRTAFAAISTASLMMAISTWTFGVARWSDFLDGVHEAGIGLENGIYPLFRMTSAYAAIYTLSGNAHWAMLGQAVSIGVGLILLLFVIRKRLPQRNALGLVCLSSGLWSPYFYDYDLPVLGIGVALLLPAILQKVHGRQLGMAITGMMLIQGGWLRQWPLELINKAQGLDTQATPTISFAFLFFLPLLALAVRLVNSTNEEPTPFAPH